MANIDGKDLLAALRRLVAEGAGGSPYADRGRRFDRGRDGARDYDDGDEYDTGDKKSKIKKRRQDSEGYEGKRSKLKQAEQKRNDQEKIIDKKTAKIYEAEQKAKLANEIKRLEKIEAVKQKHFEKSKKIIQELNDEEIKLRKELPRLKAAAAKERYGEVKYQRQELIDVAKRRGGILGAVAGYGETATNDVGSRLPKSLKRVRALQGAASAAGDGVVGDILGGGAMAAGTAVAFGVVSGPMLAAAAALGAAASSIKSVYDKIAEVSEGQVDFAFQLAAAHINANKKIDVSAAEMTNTVAKYASEFSSAFGTAIIAGAKFGKKIGEIRESTIKVAQAIRYAGDDAPKVVSETTAAVFELSKSLRVPEEAILERVTSGVRELGKSGPEFTKELGGVYSAFEATHVALADKIGDTRMQQDEFTKTLFESARDADLWAFQHEKVAEIMGIIGANAKEAGFSVGKLDKMQRAVIGTIAKSNTFVDVKAGEKLRDADVAAIAADPKYKNRKEREKYFIDRYGLESGVSMLSEFERYENYSPSEKANEGKIHAIAYAKGAGMGSQAAIDAKIQALTDMLARITTKEGKRVQIMKTFNIDDPIIAGKIMDLVNDRSLLSDSDVMKAIGIARQAQTEEQRSGKVGGNIPVALAEKGLEQAGKDGAASLGALAGNALIASNALKELSRGIDYATGGKLKSVGGDLSLQDVFKGAGVDPRMVANRYNLSDDGFGEESLVDYMKSSSFNKLSTADKINDLMNNEIIKLDSGRANRLVRDFEDWQAERATQVLNTSDYSDRRKRISLRELGIYGDAAEGLLGASSASQAQVPWRQEEVEVWSPDGMIPTQWPTSKKMDLNSTKSVLERIRPNSNPNSPLMPNPAQTPPVAPPPVAPTPPEQEIPPGAQASLDATVDRVTGKVLSGSFKITDGYVKFVNEGKADAGAIASYSSHVRPSFG